MFDPLQEKSLKSFQICRITDFIVSRKGIDFPFPVVDNGAPARFFAMKSLTFYGMPGGVKAPSYPSGLDMLLRVSPDTFVDDRGYLEAGTKRVWATFRACHIVASTILSTTMMVQGETTRVAAVSAELNALLKNPNRYESWEEMLYMWTFHMKLCGKAYWYKSEMNGAGKPKEVYPLLPQFMKEVRVNSTDRISYYEYRPGNGTLIRFELDEIIHWRRPHPASQIRGLGDIEASGDLIPSYVTAGKLRSKFLENGATPSGVMAHEEVVDPDEMQKHKARFIADYQGQRNAGKIAFMSGKWNYVKLGLSSVDMQALETERWSITQIFAMHGVPMSLAGIENASNLATARQDDINFRKFEVVPLLDLFVGKLNGWVTSDKGRKVGTFIKAYSPAWVLAYELSGLIDVEQIVKDYGPLVDKGAMTRNELREKAGLERDESNPYLDEYLVGNIPLEMAGMIDTPVSSDPPPAPGQPAAPPSTP